MNDNYLKYSAFGAKGDGIADDLDAIIRTHEVANVTGKTVRADSGATYYIGETNKTAIIQTDTDWGDAQFIIDDSYVSVDDRCKHIFEVSSAMTPINTDSVKSIKKEQNYIHLTLPHMSLIKVTDETCMRYIRKGLNQDSGFPQTEVFIVFTDGAVDTAAPLVWDFDNISSLTAYPIDTMTLKVSGGHFTTIANRAESNYTYYNRGILITRSNTQLDGICHIVEGELEHGAPYRGFISIERCAFVTVRSCKVSGHKIYSTVGTAGESVTMGSYDISVNETVGVSFINCKQLNDVRDNNLWGVFTSNYSKNILFDNVEFSRFDAHMGVVNVTIRNSVIGYMEVKLIGTGTALIENTSVYSDKFIELREDYGSTWDGDIIIQNCEFVPCTGLKGAVLIYGCNTGDHDFGYPCQMPSKVVIDGLKIDDRHVAATTGYKGPRIFDEFNDIREGSVDAPYPYKPVKELVLKDITVVSGKDVTISDNEYLLRDLVVTKK